MCGGTPLKVVWVGPNQLPSTAWQQEMYQHSLPSTVFIRRQWSWGSRQFVSLPVPCVFPVPVKTCRIKGIECWRSSCCNAMLRNQFGLAMLFLRSVLRHLTWAGFEFPSAQLIFNLSSNQTVREVTSVGSDNVSSPSCKKFPACPKTVLGTLEFVFVHITETHTICPHAQEVLAVGNQSHC